MAKTYDIETVNVGGAEVACRRDGHPRPHFRYVFDIWDRELTDDELIAIAHFLAVLKGTIVNPEDTPVFEV